MSNTVKIRNNSGSLTTLGPLAGINDPETGEVIRPALEAVSIFPHDTAEVPLDLMALHAGNAAFEARFKSKELEILKPEEDAPVLVPSDLGKPPENTPAP
jgi:hypothetical protein